MQSTDPSRTWMLQDSPRWKMQYWGSVIATCEPVDVHNGAILKVSDAMSWGLPPLTLSEMSSKQSVMVQQEHAGKAWQGREVIEKYRTPHLKFTPDERHAKYHNLFVMVPTACEKPSFTLMWTLLHYLLRLSRIKIEALAGDAIQFVLTWIRFEIKRVLQGCIIWLHNNLLG